jgi:hypothetical protein
MGGAHQRPPGRRLEQPPSSAAVEIRKRYPNFQDFELQRIELARQFLESD